MELSEVFEFSYRLGVKGRRHLQGSEGFYPVSLYTDNDKGDRREKKSRVSIRPSRREIERQKGAGGRSLFSSSSSSSSFYPWSGDGRFLASLIFPNLLRILYVDEEEDEEEEDDEDEDEEDEEEEDGDEDTEGLEVGMMDDTRKVKRKRRSIKIFQTFTLPSTILHFHWSPSSSSFLRFLLLLSDSTVRVFSLPLREEEEDGSSSFSSSFSSCCLVIDQGILAISSASWSPDGSHILTACEGGVRVSVWNVAREDQQEINSSSSLFASSSPLSLEVNEEYLEIPELVVSYPKSPTPVHAFSFSGKFWAVCTAVDCKEYLEIYSTASWKKIKEFPVQSVDAQGLLWTPRDFSLVVWESPILCRLYVYHSVSGHAVFTYEPYRDAPGIRQVEMDERRSLLLIGLYDETVRVLCMSRWMEICAPFRHLEKLRLEEKKEDKKKKKKKSNDSEQEEEEEEDHEDSASSFSSSLILVLREERVSTKEEEEEDQEVLNKEDRENEEEEEETTSKRVVLSRPKSSQGVKSRCRGVPASTQTSRQVSVDHEDEEEEGEHRFSQRERKKKDQRRKTDDPSQETSLPTVYRQLWVSRISESESEREEEVSVKEKREKKKMNRNKVGGRNEGKQKKNEEEEESEDREDGEDEGEEKEAPFTSTEESKKKKKERERDGEKDEDEKENFKGNGMSNQRKEEKKKQEKTLQISPAEKKKKVRYLRLPTKRDTSFLSISDHLQDVSRHFDTKIAGHSSLYERERRRASAFHERGGAREEADDLTAGRGGGLALLALSPCGRFLATKNERQPRVVYIWDLFRGILFSLLIHLSNVTHFSWSRHPLSSLSPLNACLGIVTDEKKFFLWTPRWQSIVSLSSPATPLSCVHPPSAISSSSSLVGCRRFVWSPGGTSFLLQAANDRAMVVLPHCLYTPPRGPSQLRRRRREPFNPFLSSSSSFLGPPDLLLPLYSSHSSHAFLGIETEEEEDSGKE